MGHEQKTFKEGSDVDIKLVGNKISFKTITLVKDDLAESNIPYFFDVLDLKTVTSKEIKGHI